MGIQQKSNLKIFHGCVTRHHISSDWQKPIEWKNWVMGPVKIKNFISRVISQILVNNNKTHTCLIDLGLSLVLEWLLQWTILLNFDIDMSTEQSTLTYELLRRFWRIDFALVLQSIHIYSHASLCHSNPFMLILPRYSKASTFHFNWKSNSRGLDSLLMSQQLLALCPLLVYSIIRSKQNNSRHQQNWPWPHSAVLRLLFGHVASVLISRKLKIWTKMEKSIAKIRYQELTVFLIFSFIYCQGISVERREDGREWLVTSATCRWFQFQAQKRLPNQSQKSHTVQTKQTQAIHHDSMLFVRIVIS